MTKLLKISALALALQPLTTLAAPVTLQGTWKCVGGPTSCFFDSPGVLTFTYDDSVAGVFPSVSGVPRETYANAIISATMTFTNLNLTFDAAYGSAITIYLNPESGTDARMRFSMRDQNNTLFQFDSAFEDGARKNTNTELSALKGLRPDEGFTFLYPDGTPNGPIMLDYMLMSRIALQEVPVPAAAWLFGSALLGLAGMTKRRRR